MQGMLKKIIELLICFLHPIAVVLIWINLAVRTDHRVRREAGLGAVLDHPPGPVHLRADRQRPVVRQATAAGLSETIVWWHRISGTLVQVEGVVQGVGFRPFVYSLATRLGLAGQVGNNTAGVFIEIEGPPPRVRDFLARLEREAPPLARIDAVRTTAIEPSGGAGFAIASSEPGGRRQALVSADSATCADCLAELADPADRRFGYPFINCTNCGPRFTIVRDVPYDRPLTTMAGFALCAACAAEYHDPADRRFHAQPVCCPACGPRLRLLDASGSELAGRSDRRGGGAAGRRARCSRSRAWAAITSRSTRAASRRGGAAGAQAPRGQAVRADGGRPRGGPRLCAIDQTAASLLTSAQAADRAAPPAGRRAGRAARWRRAPASSA